MTTDFKDFSDCYREELQKSIKFIGGNVDFFTEIKARYLCEIAKKYIGETKKLSALDIGCGIGLTDSFLNNKFGKLYGVDINDGVLEKAVLANPSVIYQVYDGKNLPFSDSSMDIVFAINVMHHITPGAWLDMVIEFRRVAKKEGLVVIFEHNPFNPLTRRVVNTCIFDTDAVLLKKSTTKSLIINSGMNLIESRYILFFPFRSPIFSFLDRMLGRLPLGAQYFVVGRKS